MTEDELEQTLSVRFEEGCAEGWADLLLEHGLIGTAMDLALHRKGVIPFRAAYALERAFGKAPERFVPYYERFAADYPAAVHPSVWRHYGKIMAILLKKKALALTDEQTARIAETALERLVDERIPVGARVWSLDILYYLRGHVRWIDQELPVVLDGLRTSPTPAMISRLRRFGFMRR
jgi:hypothetical protein